MSNFLTIATVTATLRRVLLAAVSADVPGAAVTIARPDSAGAGPRAAAVNVFLYRVSTNPNWSNADLPTRRSEGQLVQRPVAALDLHYLLSFYGDESRLEPQRLLGSAVRTLHSQPILTHDSIQKTIAAADPNLAFLANSDLANEVELVKFTPFPLSNEELSKIWSMFFQTPYAITIAYQASVVFIEDQSTPQQQLPVRDRLVYAMPFRQPVIEGIAAEEGPYSPIVFGSTLDITGKRLLAPITRVRVAGKEVTPLDAGDQLVKVALAGPDLSADILLAGVQGLQVVQKTLMGRPPAEHEGFESNVAAFVLRPTIITPVENPTNVQGTGEELRSARISIRVNPKIGKNQRIALLLNQISSDKPESYVFLEQPLAADSDTVGFQVTGVKKADYLVRIQVDGAESPLISDTNPDSPTFRQYINPKVTIP